MVTMDISKVKNKAALTNVSLVKYVIYIRYFMIWVFFQVKLSFAVLVVSLVFFSFPYVSIQIDSYVLLYKRMPRCLLSK